MWPLMPAAILVQSALFTTMMSTSLSKNATNFAASASVISVFAGALSLAVSAGGAFFSAGAGAFGVSAKAVVPAASTAARVAIRISFITAPLTERGPCHGSQCRGKHGRLGGDAACSGITRAGARWGELALDLGDDRERELLRCLGAELEADRSVNPRLVERAGDQALGPRPRAEHADVHRARTEQHL